MLEKHMLSLFGGIMTEDCKQAPGQRVKNVLETNYVMHQFDLALATEDYRYLRQRRDQLSEKLKIGLVSINGASLIALLGAMGGQGVTARWLGLTSQTALGAGLLFTVGVILANHSLNVTGRLYVKEAGDAVGRMHALSRMVASCEALATEDNRKNYSQGLKEVHALPLVGFQWSWWSIVVENFAGGCWRAGMATALSIPLRPGWYSFWHSINASLVGFF